MNPSEYNFKATIKTGHRVTIPSFIIKDWELIEDDEIYVKVTRISKTIEDTNTVITKPGE